LGVCIFRLKVKGILILSDSTTPVIGVTLFNIKFGGFIVIRFIPGGVLRTNGTDIVRYDIKKNTTVSVIQKEWKDLGCIDLRGGSQVLSWEDRHICLCHETFLHRSEQDRKDGTYRHRFVVWDKDWNNIRVSKQFSFLTAEIEFAVGMCEYGNDFLITFGFQDNAAYLLRAPQSLIHDFIFGKN
jgi:hypothetical protein